MVEKNGKSTPRILQRLRRIPQSNPLELGSRQTHTDARGASESRRFSQAACVVLPCDQQSAGVQEQIGSEEHRPA